MGHLLLKIIDSILIIFLVLLWVAILLCGFDTLFALVFSYLFPIDISHMYDWIGGIFHGLLSAGNYFLSFFNESRLISAPQHTVLYEKWYNVFFWIVQVKYGFMSIVGLVAPTIACCKEKECNILKFEKTNK